MRKTFFAVAAALLLAGSMSSGAWAADKLKVGFIYLGPVGDLGWTYQHEIGRQELVKALGDKIETTYLENVSEGPDAERSIEQLPARATSSSSPPRSATWTLPSRWRKNFRTFISSTRPGTSATRTWR